MYPNLDHWKHGLQKLRLRVLDSAGINNVMWPEIYELQVEVYWDSWETTDRKELLFLDMEV